MKNTDKRFETIYKQQSLGDAISIMRDKETGVCYLFRSEGYSGGLTVLVDSEGKPVISK